MAQNTGNRGCVDRHAFRHLEGVAQLGQRDVFRRENDPLARFPILLTLLDQFQEERLMARQLAHPRPACRTAPAPRSPRDGPCRRDATRSPAKAGAGAPRSAHCARPRSGAETEGGCRAIATLYRRRVDRRSRAVDRSRADPGPRRLAVAAERRRRARGAPPPRPRLSVTRCAVRRSKAGRDRAELRHSAQPVILLRAFAAALRSEDAPSVADAGDA